MTKETTSIKIDCISILGRAAFSTLVLAVLATGCAGPSASQPDQNPPAPDSASKQIVAAQEGDWDLDGTSLHYRTIGAGQPIVLLHGGPGGNYDVFEPLEELADSYKLIMYDQRASGRSARIPVEQLNKDPGLISVSKHVEDLEAVRKKLGLEKMIILGHSWGASLAAFYAAEYPQNIDKLILYNGGPVWPELLQKRKEEIMKRLPVESVREIEAQVKLLSENITTWDQKKLDEWFINIAKLNVPTLYCDPTQISKSEIGPGGFWANFLTNKYQEDFDIDKFKNSIAKLKAPVLLTSGRCEVSPLERQTVLQKAISGALLVVFKNSGHHPLTEEHDLFIRTIRAFLEGQPLPLEVHSSK
jgi:proline iminopeptidase